MRYLNFNDNPEVLSGMDRQTERELTGGVCAAIEVLRSNAVYTLNELVSADFKNMNMSSLLYTPASFADAKSVIS